VEIHERLERLRRRVELERRLREPEVDRAAPDQGSGMRSGTEDAVDLPLAGGAGGTGREDSVDGEPLEPRSVAVELAWLLREGLTDR
jgi:hypothetical protein